MKKFRLLWIVLTCVNIFAQLPPFTVYNKEIKQSYGTDIFSIVQTGDSTDFNTTKDEFRFNKDCKIKNDTVVTLSRLNGYAKLKATQTFTKTNTFTDSMKINEFYHTSNRPFVIHPFGLSNISMFYLDSPTALEPFINAQPNYISLGISNISSVFIATKGQCDMYYYKTNGTGVNFWQYQDNFSRFYFSNGKQFFSRESGLLKLFSGYNNIAENEFFRADSLKNYYFHLPNTETPAIHFHLDSVMYKGYLGRPFMKSVNFDNKIYSQSGYLAYSISSGGDNYVKGYKGLDGIDFTQNYNKFFDTNGDIFIQATNDSVQFKQGNKAYISLKNDSIYLRKGIRLFKAIKYKFTNDTLITAGQVKQLISDSLQTVSGVTIAQVRQEISDSLVNYPTTAQMRQEISDSIATLPGGSKEFIILRFNNSNSVNKQWSITNAEAGINLYLKSKSSGFSFAGDSITFPNSNKNYSIKFSIQVIATSSTSRIVNVLVRYRNGTLLTRFAQTTAGGSSSNPCILNSEMYREPISASSVIKLWQLGTSSYTVDIAPTTYISEMKIIEE